MQTLTLQVKDARMLRTLKNLLAALDGVEVIKIESVKENVPNATTIKAIDDALSGKTIKAKSVDDLFEQILG